ncbi:MAG: hypothetical protein C0397_19350 [Odoribacter sp.]|nr:hypothetical protein [Odoribacter sp.]
MMKKMSKAELYSSAILDEIFAEITPEEAEKTTKRMLLAARIDDGIKAKGWKKKHLAEALQKHPSEVTKWLSGTHNFNSDTLFDIERVLNIGLVTLKDAPINQIIRFHVVVSEKVISTECSPFASFYTGNSFVDLYQGVKSRQYSVSSYN